ncbi:MAG: hypothetical protein AAGD18_02010 [Actinomycetota bacterium]
MPLTAASLAKLVAGGLQRAETQGQMLRWVRQFVADADRADDPSALVDDVPAGTGDERWDALIAGVVEDIAFRLGLPVPPWVREPERSLDTWWFVTRFPSLHATAFVQTPPTISAHGVFIGRDSLVNV